MKLLASLGILTLGLMLSARISPAKPEYTRRTHKDCEFCHPPDSRKLTRAGEYFRDHGDSLQGYQPPAQDNKKATAKPAK
ncbi:MAG: hypothetical protein ABI833_18635 [Acidobacteriota bacterium]